MNFLSHYYFERYAPESEQVLGGLLPDLLKNADKDYSFQINKFADRLVFHPKSSLITDGWLRHVEVDKVFHSSEFFYTHTHALRKQIEDVVADLPIRASFLAHIALELILDHRLIVHNVLSVERLYEHLEHVDRKVLSAYLSAFNEVDLDKFYRFYDRFLETRYIFDYLDINNIPHALYNICKRVWNFDVQPHHLEVLAQRLDDYNSTQLTNYKEVYIFVNDNIAM